MRPINPVMIGVVAVALLHGVVSVLGSRTKITVIDGDTFKRGEEIIRILGIDAPELTKPGCDAEWLRAKGATRLLTQLLSDGRVIVERHGKDQYGRTLADVYVNGNDIGELMLEGDGVVVYDGGKRDRESWCNDDND